MSGSYLYLTIDIIRIWFKNNNESFNFTETER